MTQVAGLAVLVGVFGVISSHLETMEETGIPVLLTLQQTRSNELDMLVWVFSAMGMEVFFFLIPLCLFWVTSPRPSSSSSNPQHTTVKSEWKQQWPLGM